MSNRGLFLASRFVRANLGLGIGRYVCQLQRVTLKFCKTHGASQGVREFIEHDLVDYARENPGVVVYLKPRRHRGPVIKAEYLDGHQQWIPVHNYSRDDIVKWMELMRTQMRDGTKTRLRKLWHTEFPSIQGPWTPFTFADPGQNATLFPDDAYGSAATIGSTATEEVLRIFKEQQEQDKRESEKSKHESDGSQNIKVQRGTD